MLGCIFCRPNPALQPNLLVPPALLPCWRAPPVPQKASWGLRELQPYSTSHSLDSPLQGSPPLAPPAVAALPASACLPHPGGHGVGSEQDGAPRAGQLPATHAWPHRTHAPTGEPDVPLGPAPEDAPPSLTVCLRWEKEEERREGAAPGRCCEELWSQRELQALRGFWAGRGGKGARGGGGGGITHRAARLLILPFLAVQTADLSLGTRMRDSLKETPAEKQTDERTDGQTDRWERKRQE